MIDKIFFIVMVISMSSKIFHLGDFYWIAKSVIVWNVHVLKYVILEGISRKGPDGFNPIKFVKKVNFLELYLYI